MTTLRSYPTLGLCIGLILAGCSHSGSQTGGDNAADANDEMQSIGGVWNGTDASGQSVVAMADEAGEFHIILEDGTQYEGTASTMGKSVSADTKRLSRHSSPDAPVPSAPPASPAATVKGTIEQRQSMSLTVAPAAKSGAFLPDTFALEFNSMYNDPSSLRMVAGDYVDPISGNTINIAGSGTLFWRRPDGSCLAEGAVSIIDARYDLYEVQFGYSACTGSLADLNGMQFAGLGTLDTSVQPAQLTVGVTADMGGRAYAIDLKLQKLPPKSPI